jgi:hypothetical protein
MKFLYEWFAGYKDSCLKQITCAKCWKAIILPLAWLFILYGWLNSWVVRSGFKWLRFVQVSTFVSLGKASIWLGMLVRQVVQVFIINSAVDIFQG